MCDCGGQQKRKELNFCPKTIITKPKKVCSEYTTYRTEPREVSFEYPSYEFKGGEVKTVTKKTSYTVYDLKPETHNTCFETVEFYEKCLRCGRERKL